MGLLSPGYFQERFFPLNYWSDLYWQNYVVGLEDEIGIIFDVELADSIIFDINLLDALIFNEVDALIFDEDGIGIILDVELADSITFDINLLNALIFDVELMEG